MPTEGNIIIPLTSRAKRLGSCGNVIRRIHSVTENLFQVETQVASVLEITQKCCSSTLEISAFDTLNDCQGYSELACHFCSGKSLHLPQMGKPLTHSLNNTSAIGFPELRGQEKYDIIVNMYRYL